jgi:hypothetical protein
MSLNGASLPIGATFAPTGGAATTISSLGTTADSNKLFVDDGSDLIVRKTILATSKAPVPSASAPNGYTQQRTTIVMHIPLLLDNAKYTTNTIRIEFAYDPETSAAELATMRDWLTNMAVDADFDSLFEDGSVA